MTQLIDLDILTSESADKYHAKAGEYMSSHQLIDFMACPFLYLKRRNGLVEDKESSAFLVGRAAHTRILEGIEVYEREYAIGGPINPTTGKPYGSTTKKFLEWQELQQKPIIPIDKADLIEQMHSGVRMNAHACELLTEGRAEGVVRTDYRGFQCQIRIDWTNPEHGIVDFKTCDDLTWFENDARRYRYHYQLAFYQAVLAQVVGQFVPVYIIAVEKREPFRCGVWQFEEETLALARAEINSALERLMTARQTDIWATGFEDLRILSII
jgi:hypothetical protein